MDNVFSCCVVMAHCIPRHAKSLNLASKTGTPFYSTVGGVAWIIWGDGDETFLQYNFFSSLQFAIMLGCF
jgi:hypothetical protein